MFRYPYDVAREPPAPVLPIRVGPPGEAPAIFLVALVDTGADVSVVPDELARRLGFPAVGEINVQGVDGVTRRATVYAAEIETDVVRQAVEVVGLEQEALIGRDLLNLWTVILHGPERAMEIRQGKQL